jgi:hypothetical protein
MDKKLPKASYEGVLKLGDAELDVAVLDNGTRIITQTAVFKALDRPSRGNSRVINIPTFMDAQNLQPFINEELMKVINKVEYIDKNGKIQEGYDATILPLVSDLYLKAREAKVIKLPSQLETAKKAEILVRSLAKLGITALIDEATGYQYEREKDELQKILKAYIAEELLSWQKTFPDKYYMEIYRLNGWDFTVKSIKQRPGVIGTWTNKLIYEQLPKGVLEELKAKTPKSSAGNYTARFFQSLTPDYGSPHLQNQLNSVITLMQVSDNWKQFLTQFNKLVDRQKGQLELKFEDLEYKPENDKLKKAEPEKKPIKKRQQQNLFDQQLKGLLAVPPPKKEEKAQKEIEGE